MSINVKEVSAEALAYLGDSVIELKVRELLVNQGIGSSGVPLAAVPRLTVAHSRTTL